jgi:hypothetical protein
VRLLQAGAIVVAALLEATVAVAAPGVLTEEVTGEAMLGAVVILETPKAAEVKVEVMGEAVEVTVKLRE